jgi:hypothetical protein
MSRYDDVAVGVISADIGLTLERKLLLGGYRSLSACPSRTLSILHMPL